MRSTGCHAAAGGVDLACVLRIGGVNDSNAADRRLGGCGRHWASAYRPSGTSGQNDWRKGSSHATSTRSVLVEVDSGATRSVSLQGNVQHYIASQNGRRNYSLLRKSKLSKDSLRDDDGDDGRHF